MAALSVRWEAHRMFRTVTRPTRVGQGPCTFLVGAAGFRETTLECGYPGAEVVVGGRGKVVVNGVRLRVLVERTVRFPRGNGGVVDASSSCQAVNFGFQAVTGATSFVDLVAKVVELSEENLHDARDLLAGFDA